MSPKSHAILFALAKRAGILLLRSAALSTLALPILCALALIFWIPCFSMLCLASFMASAEEAAKLPWLNWASLPHVHAAFALLSAS